MYTHTNYTDKFDSGKLKLKTIWITFHSPSHGLQNVLDETVNHLVQPSEEIANAWQKRPLLIRLSNTTLEGIRITQAYQ